MTDTDTDVVERLRAEAAEWAPREGAVYPGLFVDAAAEITRLRAQVETLAGALERARWYVAHYDAVADRRSSSNPSDHQNVVDLQMVDKILASIRENADG